MRCLRRTAIIWSVALAGALAFGAIAAPALAQKIYEYDELGRLKKATDTRAGYQQTYTYDAAGNRSSVAATLAGDVSFSINDVSAAEGGSLVFMVTKNGVAFQSHDVSFATANGTAASSDYTAQSSSLTFGVSDVTKTISVTTTEDYKIESNETLHLNLSNATGGATISDSQGVGTINNDDVLVQSAAGVIQSPYEGETTFPFWELGPPLGWIAYAHIYTDSSHSTLVYQSAGGGFCDHDAIVIAANYSFVGSGCKFVYSSP